MSDTIADYGIIFLILLSLFLSIWGAIEMLFITPLGFIKIVSAAIITWAIIPFIEFLKKKEETNQEKGGTRE